MVEAMVQHPMSWGRSLYLHSSPVPGHELVDARLRPAIDESGQQVGEVDLRIELFILQVYAARRTMPNGLVFPRSDCDLDMIGSA